MRMLLTGLAPDAKYAIQLRTKVGEEYSDWSRVFELDTDRDLLAPKAVTNLVTTLHEGNLRITWTAPQANTDDTPLDDLRDYRLVIGPIVPDPLKPPRVYFVEGTSFVFPKEANVAAFGAFNPDLSVSVEARDIVGNLSQPVVNNKNKARPNPVTGLVWAPVRSSFSASWNTPTNNMDGTPFDDLNGYEVVVSWNGISKTYIVRANTFTFSYDDNKAAFSGTARTPLGISIRARDSVGQFSDPQTATASNANPLAVTSVSGTALQDSIRVTWMETTDDDIVAYDIYSAPTVGGAGTLVARVPAPAREYIHQTVAYSSDHFIYVIAVDQFGLSSPASGRTTGLRPKSPFAVDTTIPAATTVTAVTGTTPVTQPASINLSWPAVSDTDLAGYHIRYSVNATPRVWQFLDVVDKTATSQVITNLRSATSYVFQIRSYDKSINTSAWSTPEVSATSSTSNVIPSDISTDIQIISGGTLRSSNYVESTPTVPGAGWLISPSLLNIEQGKVNARVVSAGELRSNVNITDSTKGTVGQPLWSLNLNGNMSINDAQVRGKIVVGSPSDTAAQKSKIAISSSTYGGSGPQWAILADGTFDLKSGVTGQRLAVTSSGIIGHNGTVETFNLGTNGNLKLTGEVNATTGTFSGTITATGRIEGGVLAGANIYGSVYSSNETQTLNQIRIGPSESVYSGSGPAVTFGVPSSGTSQRPYIRYDSTTDNLAIANPNGATFASIELAADGKTKFYHRDEFNTNSEGLRLPALVVDSTGLGVYEHLTFARATRQQINLYNDDYGIGVQDNTQYYRSNYQYAWFQGGAHSNVMSDPGPGGISLMRLDNNGNLYLKGNVVVGSVTGDAGATFDDSNIVHKTFMETISGQKTFTGGILKNGFVIMGQDESDARYYQRPLVYSKTEADGRFSLLTDVGTTVVAGTSYGLTSTAGTGNLWARATHSHGTPPAQVITGGTAISAVASGVNYTINNTGVTSLAVTNNASVNASTGGVTITNSLTPTFTTINTTGAGTVGGTFTSTGLITGRASVRAQSVTASTGFIQLVSGNTTNSGYVEFFKPDGTRHSYIGYNTATGPIDYNSATGHTFTGGNFAFSGTLTAGTVPWARISDGPPAWTTAATANTLAVRDGSADIHARLFRSEYTPTTGSANFFMVQHVAGGAGADNYLRPATAATVANRMATEGLAWASHKYHQFANNQYFYDNYEQGNYLRIFLENSAFTTTRYQTVYNVEYWDGAAWVAWAGGDAIVKNLLDGSESTTAFIDHTHRKFRFTLPSAGGYPTLALYFLQSSWSPIAYPSTTVTIEDATSLAGVYTQRDQAIFNSTTTGGNWGTHLKTTSALHNGASHRRYTIDITDWVDSGTTTTIPFKRFEVLSNYQGTSLLPYTWDYNKNITTPGRITAKEFYATEEFFGARGTAANVSYGFSDNGNTGMWSPAVDQLGFATGGVNRVTLTTTAETHTLPTTFNSTLTFTGSLHADGKKIFTTNDSHLRINQSSEFANGIWLGSSNLRMNQGTFYVGSSGGDGNIALIPTTADITRRITLDGGTGAITNVGISTSGANSVIGLIGAQNASRHVGATLTGPPTTGTFEVGDFVIARDGVLWICTNGGTPGTWKNEGPALANTVVNETTWGLTPTFGSLMSLAREDHTHGTPPTPVTAAVGGTGISVSAATGSVTFTNTGILSVAGGTGITASTTGGATTLANTGVLSVTASGNLSSSGGQNPAISLTLTPTFTTLTATTSSGVGLNLYAGNSSGASAASQIALGYAGGANYRHSIRTRHNNGVGAGNAIDFYLWQYGTDVIGTLGSFKALTVDTTGIYTFASLFENGNRVYSAANPNLATAVVSETAWGQAAAVGNGTAFARDNHTHGTQPTPVTSLSKTSNNLTLTGSTGAVTLTLTDTPTWTGQTVNGTSTLNGAVNAKGIFKVLRTDNSTYFQIDPAASQITFPANSISGDALIDDTVAYAKLSAATRGLIEAGGTSKLFGGSNLLANSSFEDTTRPFVGANGATFAYSTARAAHGTTSVLVTLPTFVGQAGLNVTASQTQTALGLMPDTPYVFTAWAYNPTTGGAPEGIQVSAQGSGLVGNTTARDLTRDKWIRLTVPFTTNSDPAGTLALYVLSNNSTAGQQFFIDAVQLEHGNVATAYSPKTDEILPGTVVDSMVGTVGVSKLIAGAITTDDINIGSAGRIYAGASKTAASRLEFVGGGTDASRGIFAYSGGVNTVKLAADGSFMLQSAAAGARIDIDSATGIEIWNASERVFQATPAGALNLKGIITATGGAIGGYTIGTTDLNVGGTSTSSATISSVDGIYLGGTSTTAPFRVTKAGVLVATSANITGAITATSGSFTGSVTSTSGTIGGFSLGTTSLYAGTGATRVQMDTASGFFAGNNTPASAPFQVTPAGALRATNATITGAITATSGSFTGAITATSLSLTGAMTLGASGSINLASKFTVNSAGRVDASDIHITAGDLNIGSGKFVVTSAGILTAIDGNFSGTLTGTGIRTSTTVGNGLATGAGVVVDTSGVRAFAANNSVAVTNINSTTGVLTATGATISGAITATSGSFTGSITASSGTIGGFTIGGTTLTATNITIDSANGKMTTGTGDTVAVQSRTEGFYAGNAAQVSAPFSVDLTGYLKTTRGIIGGFEITNTQLNIGGTATESITLSTADGIYLGGPVATAKFHVTKAGILTAVDGIFKGTIQAGSSITGATFASSNGLFAVDVNGALTAQSGTIGGWNIETGRLRSSDSTVVLSPTTGIQLGTVTDFANAEFTVTPAGAVKATSGAIGGWTLGPGLLYSGATTARIAMSTTSGFYAGAEDPGLAPFQVTPQGVLRATSANITGTINANDGTIGGWNAANGNLSSGTTMVLSPTTGIMVGTTGVFSTSEFSVSPSGGLRAVSGFVGGWNIKSDRIVSQEGTAGETGLYGAGTTANTAIWAGGPSSTAPFRVLHNGTLSASGVDISGSITASTLSVTGNSTLFGWNLYSGHLWSGTGTSRIAMHTTQGFYAGSSTASSAKFQVTPAGTIRSGASGGTRLEIDNDTLSFFNGTTATPAIISSKTGGWLSIRSGIGAVEIGDANQNAVALKALNNISIDGATVDINGVIAGSMITDAATPNTLMKRNGSGDVFARLFRMEYASLNSTINYFATLQGVGAGGNNYIRPSTPAQVASVLADTTALVANHFGATRLGSGRQTYTSTTGSVKTGTFTWGAAFSILPDCLTGLETASDASGRATSVSTTSVGWRVYSAGALAAGTMNFMGVI